MRNYIEWHLKEYGYPEQSHSTVLNTYDKIMTCEVAAKGLEKMIAEYNESCNAPILDNVIKMKELSAAAGINEYEGAIIPFICYSKRLKEYYDEQNLDDQMYRDVISDLTYKMIECKMIKGVWGTFVANWFRRFYDLSRFSFGKLQFEITDFKSTYSKNGVELNETSQVINVHIPRTGGKLDDEGRKSAYAKGAEFFKERYGFEKIIFVCSSWLLFEKHAEFLNESSNLYHFIKDYDIYDKGTYADYVETWRLFDTEYTPNHSALPANSSLRRAYIDLMNKGEPTGWGKGVYIYN